MLSQPDASCPPRAAIRKYLHVVHPDAPRPRLIAEDENSVGGTDAFSWKVNIVVALKLVSSQMEDSTGSIIWSRAAVLALTVVNANSVNMSPW